MKPVRIVFLTITLTLLIIALVFNMTSNKITNEIVNGIIESIIPKETTEKVKDNKITNWFNDLKENEDVQNFIDQYIGSDTISKAKDKINEVTEEVKKGIEETVDEFIKEQEDKLNPGQKIALNIFRFLTDAKLKGILMILIGLNILLIALVEASIFKWIKSTCWAMALSGVSILLLVEWIKNSIYSLIKLKVTFPFVTTPAIILLISGIVIRCIYLIISMIIKANKGDEENEVS